MKLLPPLPPPRLLPSRPQSPAPPPPPVAIGRRAWRPDADFPPPQPRTAARPPLLARLRAVPRSRLVFAGLTLTIVGAIMALFLLESRWGYSGRVVPVVFFQSWPAGRTGADAVADQQAAIARAHADEAASQAYIATLTGPAKVKAQNQYDAYVAAQPKPFRPDGYVAPPKAK